MHTGTKELQPVHLENDFQGFLFHRTRCANTPPVSFFKWNDASTLWTFLHVGSVWRNWHKTIQKSRHSKGMKTFVTFTNSTSGRVLTFGPGNMEGEMDPRGPRKLEGWWLFMLERLPKTREPTCDALLRSQVENHWLCWYWGTGRPLVSRVGAEKRNLGLGLGVRTLMVSSSWASWSLISFASLRYKVSVRASSFQWLSATNGLLYKEVKEVKLVSACIRLAENNIAEKESQSASPTQLWPSTRSPHEISNNKSHLGMFFGECVSDRSSMFQLCLSVASWWLLGI